MRSRLEAPLPEPKPGCGGASFHGAGKCDSMNFRIG
jgi:hypothetical protein